MLRLCGLRPGTAEESLHSPEELKLLIAASQEGGLLQEAQQEVVERVLNIGDRRISAIMTPRVDVDWIDSDDDREAMLRSIRECRHGQLLVGKGSIDEPLGMILKHSAYRGVSFINVRTLLAHAPKNFDAPESEMPPLETTDVRAHIHSMLTLRMRPRTHWLFIRQCHSTIGEASENDGAESENEEDYHG